MSDLVTGRELAEKVLKHVTEHPDSHFQEAWMSGSDRPVNLNECGTFGCLAGWAVTLNARPAETPRQALHRIARYIGIFPSWESVAAELLTPPGCSQEPVRDIFHTASEKAAISGLAEYFDLEVPTHE
jgi:hypothetical protein